MTKLITMLTDAAAFIIQCNHDVNHSRRMALKEEPHRGFVALCNVNAPPGQYLFGVLSKHTKKIAEANKITKRVSSAGNTSQKQRQHESDFYFSRQTKIFLGTKQYCRREETEIFGNKKLLGSRKKHAND